MVAKQNVAKQDVVVKLHDFLLLHYPVKASVCLSIVKKIDGKLFAKCVKYNFREIFFRTCNTAEGIKV